MESKTFASNQNGDSLHLTFNPEVRKVTRLGNIKDPQIIKSPSWPSSPTIPRHEIRQTEPIFWTLGRRKLPHKGSDENFLKEISLCDDRKSAVDEYEQMRTILTNMNLKKYYLRRDSNPNSCQNDMHFPLRRSVSVQPQTNTSINCTGKRSFLDDIPPPPKTKSILELSKDNLSHGNNILTKENIYSLDLSPVKSLQKPVNSKLRELTERLRPASAPPSPHRAPKYTVPRSAPPMSNFSFWKDPLPNENSLMLSYNKSFKDLSSMDSTQDQIISKNKVSKLPKPIRKNNIASYATLPRTKVLESAKEPRTLASLDLNINFQPYRESYKLADSDINNSNRDRENFGNYKKDVDKEDLKSNRNNKNNFHESESENHEDFCSPPRSRKGSIKNSNTSKKGEFDLNFVNYGSLNSSRTERRKSLDKKDTDASHVHSSEPRKRSLAGIEICDREISSNNKTEKSHKSNGKTTNESMNSDEKRHYYHSDGSKSVPVLPNSSENPLEEDIRTIARLLDGKESLFLKLIQSSKIENEASKQAINSYREAISPKPGEKLQSAPDISQKSSDLRSSDRNSPTRIRAMTVPGTEPNRNVVANQISPPPQQKRFYKKRLRGPYGEMLEQEMSKSFNKPRPSYAKDLDFLKELDNVTQKASSSDKESERPRTLLRSSSHSFDETHSIVVDGAPKRKTSANIPIVSDNEEHGSLRVPSTSVSGTVSEPTLHIRSHSDSVKTSSAWNVDNLISKVLKQNAQQDIRTHIVGELYETEFSYVESLQIIIKKYMIPLKGSEHSEEIEGSQVDQIFCQVPEILKFHETFLETLKSRLSYWDTKQKIGDVFIDVFTRSAVVDTYINFINNWKSARDAIKSISLAKPAFAKFLENTSREHKGKLTLDALLIMPVQRIPRYELLIKELLKHTPMDHPDYKLLLQAQKEVHELAVKINKVEREALQLEQRLQRLGEVEHLIEGITDLTQGDRSFIRHDFVLIPGGLGLKKERCLFLFSDMLLITSIKRKGGAIRKTSIAVSAAACGSLESNKYKLLMRTSLHNVDIIKTDVEEPCVRTFLKEVSGLESDIGTLGKISDIIGSLHCEHQILEEVIKDLLSSLTKQLAEKQASCSQLMHLDLAIKINDEVENISLVFPNPEQRMTFEAAFLDAKEKLDNAAEKTPSPEFLCSLPLRKTRAGLLITCAAAVVDTCQNGLPDLWICSSDGLVGQVCVLTFQNEPVIASSVAICEARIICIAAVPGVSSGSLLVRRRSTLFPYLPGFKFEKLDKGDIDQGKSKRFPLDSDSDEDYIDATDEFGSEDANTLQPTMWLGTEDGRIYIYNCTDVRLQRPKLRLYHSTSIYHILHVNERVFVSLANGEIAIYSRDDSGLWNTSSPHKVQVANEVSPILKMILVAEKLWCSTVNSIAILDPTSLEMEHTFQVAPDLGRHISEMVLSDQGVWVTMQSSPVIHLYHSTSYDHLLELNISSPITKMISAYGEIIKRHKLACLRISSICVEKNLLWIGTSSGIILNLPIPSFSSPISSADLIPTIIGMPHGHFGYVRFITSLYATSGRDSSAHEGLSSLDDCSVPCTSADISSDSPYSALVISGGDGYEDFSSRVSADTTGRDDSTNHLLMWRV
ncbi:Rho guanine nucleotide exchange factor 17 like protein [Argiope bruennichi]|uniref:Rho guanine nucleotide exchange factor 17 like protein n=1 Tax=Argiope bruennichi TaxID=94029 RepID=A0A8T0FYE5_ARGBR|nr:Rho guanine nucleotide exchange factor 17 like protein [Argiope bruennichi]